ncbi:TPA_asm: hypothetical protein [ssRNA phage Gerhypos.2_23]|uniref:Uncharacterized protein n=2 Tax=Leviviricetes TaxID=2842243 RepID=A0A8S5L1I5_9VIRU|nr:hypothetical protein QIQ86_gp4 [ssRNA phage Gerhypos.2_23]QDH88924.1 MAG: hypothetical protein H2Bulk35329_000001 [Leviviridae sp.]DAD51339.1 TPA_asm: hypothetical protein [ssRNA phage Gerhypos.2_23]
MVFYGSPLTLALAYVILNKDIGIEDHIDHQLQNRGFFTLEVRDKEAMGVAYGSIISANEYQEALSYLHEDSFLEGGQVKNSKEFYAR